MRWFRFVGLVVTATLLQASVLGHLRISCDLLVILLVFFALFYGVFEAIIASFVIGFAADIIGFTMGPYTISFGIFGTLLAQLHQFIEVRQIPYRAAVIFVVGLLTSILSNLLTLFKAEHSQLMVLTPPIAVLICSAIVGPFLFFPAAWWMRIKTRHFS
ncbi:MAG: hypothetical protein JXB29_09090 [Sedimentisphaerales bacterium]|nr:hypothetical protein [Sedimentisphaerales bacterium]